MKIKLLRSGLALGFALLVLVLAGPSTLLAADDEKDKDGKPFTFHILPFQFEAWFTDVDTDSSKWEEYRDVDSGAVFRRLRLFGASEDGNRTFDFELTDIGRADARYTLRYRNSGRYSILLDHNLIPHRFGNNGTQLHSTATGRDNYTLPDTTQQTLQDAVAARNAQPNACRDNPGTVCTTDADCNVITPGDICINFAVDFPFLRGQLQPFINSATLVSPRLKRQRSSAVVDIGELTALAWKIDLRQETRDGSRPYGATFGFSNAIELPEPIRYDTKTANLSGEWTAKHGGVLFGLSVSDFSNRYKTLTYDNFWRVTDSSDPNAYSAPGNSSIGGPSRGRNALAPDNQAAQLYVAGHAKFGKRGFFNGKLSFGRMEQDDPLLPHTINSAINNTLGTTPPPPFDFTDPANLPALRADTSVDTLHFTANVGVKMAPWASVKFRLRYYDYNNKSPRLGFPDGYVRMDAVWEDIPRITVPYAYTRSKYGVEFGFDAAAKTHIAVGYDMLSMDRDFREIDSADEDIWHITVDSRSVKNVVLSGGWEHGDRTTDAYNTAAQLFTFTDPTEIVNNQFALRKYDEAERKYDQARVSASILAGDQVTVTLGAKLRNEDYEPSVLTPDPADPNPTIPTLPLVLMPAMGLLTEELTQYDAEVSYVPNEKLSLFVFGSRTDRETFQRARQSGGTLSNDPAANWELTLDEITDTWGLGLNAKLAPRWTLDLNGSFSDSDGNSDFFSPPGGTPDTAQGYPEYDDNRWLVYSAALGFHVSEHVSTGLTLLHDEFETNRFARMGLQPYLPGTLILDANDGDYEADLVLLGLTITY